MKDIQFASFDNQMKEQITVGQARRALIYGLGVGFLTACGVDVILNQATETPGSGSSEIDPTAVPFSKVEPLYEKDVKVFLDNCLDCDELGITKDTVAGGYFNGDFLFHSKDKNNADYFYLNQGTFFEPLNWESTDSEFALVPKANEGDIYTGLKYFIWDPNIVDSNGNMIVTYQPDGTSDTAQKFILPLDNDIQPRLKRARFVAPEISPESLLPQEVKEKFELAGIDLKDLTKDGLPITLKSGEVVLLTNDELEKNIFLGQDNVLQYRDESNQNVIYTFDKETGKWGVAVSEAESAAIALFNKYEINPVTYTLTEVDGVMIGTDKKTGKEILRGGRFELGYAVELAKKDCESTGFETDNGSPDENIKDKDSANRYLEKLLRDVNYKPEEIELLFFNVLVDRKKQCWGFADATGDALLYRDEAGLPQVIPTFFIFNR